MLPRPTSTVCSTLEALITTIGAHKGTLHGHMGRTNPPSLGRHAPHQSTRAARCMSHDALRREADARNLLRDHAHTMARSVCAGRCLEGPESGLQQHMQCASPSKPRCASQAFNVQRFAGRRCSRGPDGALRAPSSTGSPSHAHRTVPQAEATNWSAGGAPANLLDAMVHASAESMQRGKYVR